MTLHCLVWYKLAYPLQQCSIQYRISAKHQTNTLDTISNERDTYCPMNMTP